MMVNEEGANLQPDIYLWRGDGNLWMCRSMMCGVGVIRSLGPAERRDG